MGKSYQKIEEKLDSEGAELRQPVAELEKPTIDKNRLQTVIIEAIEAMSDGITVQDRDYNIIYQNEPLKKRQGEHLGEKCYRIYEGQEKVCDGCPVEKAFKDGKAHTSERRVVMPSGEVTFWEVTANPIRDDRGEVVSCLEIARNITERKKAEEALRAERNKLQSVIDALDATVDSITIRDRDYNITLQSKTSIEISGYHLGEKCYRIYEGQEKVCDGCPAEKAFKDGKAHTSERRVVALSGEVTYWENTASPIKDARGEVVACLEVGKNISKRKKGEQLQKSENYVLTLLGQGAELSELLDAIVRLGEQNDPSIKGSVMLFDPSKELLSLASAPGLPGDYKELLENGIPAEPKAGPCGAAAYLKERVIVPDIAQSPLFKPFKEVVKWAVNNGLLAVWSQPVTASNGELLGIIANYSSRVGEPSADNLRVLEWSAKIAAIAIERKQAEEREKELQRELYLSSRLASIGELAAGVAHQINNPLTGVLGFSQRLLRKSTDEESTQDLEIIYKEAERAAKVVQSLLTFARRRQPRKQYSDINAILQSVLELRAYEMKTSNIEVITHLAAGLPQIMIDFHQMQEVFLNIILNAEQAIIGANGGGKLTIKTEEKKGYIRITFTDDGPGIPAKELDKIFDPFYTTKAEKGGTGLGLSVCHGIVTEHGGKIYAGNKPGKGATFSIELPLTHVPVIG